jgi:hypothetical protein
MHSSVVKIAMASILVALTSPTHAALTRTYTNSPQYLSVNGVACPELESWLGGDASAPVVIESTGSPAKKHLGSQTNEPITLVVNLPLTPVLQNALADLCANRNTTQTLLLTDIDGSQTQVSDALLLEARFPAMDATAKETFRLTLVYLPGTVQMVTGSPAGSTGAGNRAKAIGGNFRFNLTGLPGDQVVRIETFTISRAAQADSLGANRLPSTAPTSTRIPDLNVTIARAGTSDWAAWRDDFVVRGNSDDAKEKSGSIEVLSANMQSVLLPLQLSHVGIRRFSRVPGSAPGTAEKYLAELYCEGISVASGPVVSTPSQSSTTQAGSAASTSAPASTPTEPAPADTKTSTDAKTPAKVPQKTPETPPSESTATATTGAGQTPVIAPSAGMEATTNPEDKGQRDPADFPRFTGTIRTQYEAIREKDYLREFARYTARDQADNVMAFYEKYLTGNGWEEVARYEDNNGTNRAHRINATWKKSPRTATLTFTDPTKDSVDIQIILETRK